MVSYSHVVFLISRLANIRLNMHPERCDDVTYETFELFTCDEAGLSNVTSLFYELSIM